MPALLLLRSLSVAAGVGLCLAWCLSAPAVAASPRDELLRYVPADVGFCLVVQNLRDKLGDVAASPLAQHVGKGGGIPLLAGSAEWKQLAEAEKYLKKHLGVGWADLRDDLLGDAFVFAFQPGAGGKTEQDEGMFLVRARDGKKLAALIERVNSLQKKTGELKELTDREHRGVTYVRRTERKETAYYLLRGQVLLFTGQEALLRRAIDRDKSEPADALPPFTRKLRELKLDSALVSLVLNPRAFDETIGKGGPDQAAKSLAACWKALGGVGLGVHLDRDVRLELTVQADPEKLPASARRLFAAGRPSELWSAVPDNALFAMTGRVDLVGLYGFFAEFMSKAGRQQFEGDLERTVGAVLGKDIIKELLPALGPDWGLCVLPPPADSKGWAPRALFALKVARGDETDPTDETVLSALTSLAQLGVVAQNKKSPETPVSLKTAIQGKVRVRYLAGEGSFPAGVQPAWALKDGYLLMATSPAEVKSFRLVGQQQQQGAGIPILRLSVRDVRAYLKDRRDVLAEALAAQSGTTREKAGAHLDGLRAGLELVDRVELRQQAAPGGRVTFSLTMQPAKALRR